MLSTASSLFCLEVSSNAMIGKGNAGGHCLRGIDGEDTKFNARKRANQPYLLAVESERKTLHRAQNRKRRGHIHTCWSCSDAVCDLLHSRLVAVQTKTTTEFALHHFGRRIVEFACRTHMHILVLVLHRVAVWITYLALSADRSCMTSPRAAHSAFTEDRVFWPRASSRQNRE